MAIHTPRGLKIRFSVSQAFGLMARLYPKRSAFQVLKTVEGLEVLPGLFEVIGLAFILLYYPSPFVIGITTVIAPLTGMLLVLLPGILFIVFFPVTPVLLKLSEWYSYVSGFGIFFVLLLIGIFILTGWPGVAAFVLGKIILIVLRQLLEFVYATFTEVTPSEGHFITAFRIHALRIGQSADIHITEEEQRREYWEECFKDFASKWPEVVRRFTAE